MTKKILIALVGSMLLLMNCNNSCDELPCPCENLELGFQLVFPESVPHEEWLNFRLATYRVSDSSLVGEFLPFNFEPEIGSYKFDITLEGNTSFGQDQ